MTATPDADLIVPATAAMHVDGIPVRVVRLRTRQWFALARVIGTGLGSGILDLEVDWQDPDLKEQLVAILVLALPGAEDETIAFLRTLVVPVNDADSDRLVEAMRNPSVSDVLDLVGVILDQEGDDLRGIVGKAAELAPKVSQILPRKTAGDGDRSPERST